MDFARLGYSSSMHAFRHSPQGWPVWRSTRARVAALTDITHGIVFDPSERARMLYVSTVKELSVLGRMAFVTSVRSNLCDRGSVKALFPQPGSKQLPRQIWLVLFSLNDRLGSDGPADVQGSSAATRLARFSSQKL